MTLKIYTKTGDSGETSLLGGVRVGKHDARSKRRHVHIQVLNELAARNVLRSGDVACLKFGCLADVENIGRAIRVSAPLGQCRGI